MPGSITTPVSKTNLHSSESLSSKQGKSNSLPYIWYPSVNNIKRIEYVRKLECDYEKLQAAYLSLTTQFARLQFRLRQLMQAQPMERNRLLQDLERIAFKEIDALSQCKPEELPRIERDNQKMGKIEKKQTLMVCRLRRLIANLETESDCLATEYRNDPERELELQRKCPSTGSMKDVNNRITSTNSKDSLKSN